MRRIHGLAEVLLHAHDWGEVIILKGDYTEEAVQARRDKRMAEILERKAAREKALAEEERRESEVSRPHIEAAEAKRARKNAKRLAAQ